MIFTPLPLSHLQNDRNNGQELPGRGELNPVIELFPDGSIAELRLIGCLKRRTFFDVQYYEH